MSTQSKLDDIIRRLDRIETDIATLKAVVPQFPVTPICTCGTIGNLSCPKHKVTLYQDLLDNAVVA